MTKEQIKALGRPVRSVDPDKGFAPYVSFPTKIDGKKRFLFSIPVATLYHLGFTQDEITDWLDKA